MLLVKDLDTIHIEITNKCNARCPGCERTVNGDTHPFLKANPVEWTLSDFQHKFPKESIIDTEFYFGGTVDDPLMNSHVYDITKYIIDNDGSAIIETNTGANTAETYKKLGKLSYDSKKLFVKFSVDGLEHTNHLYRVNVKWQKVMENMKAYISEKGSCQWQYLVFDHNYDDTENAKKLAKDLGVDLVLRQNVRNVKTWTSKIKSKNKETKKIETKEFKVKTTPKFQHPELNKVATGIFKKENPVTIKQKKSINCLMVHQREIFVAWNSRVWPCCWFATDSFARFDYFKKLDEKLGTNWNNLKYNSLSEILQHEYYAKILQESWTNPTFKEYYYPFCYEKCGDNNARTNYVREYLNKNEKNPL